MIPRLTVTRRAFLAGSAAAIAAARVGRAWAFAGDPFALGVASGSPGPDSVVLLATDPDRPGGMPREPVAVRWEVGRDDRLSQIVRNGEAAAMPDYAHAVHVECENQCIIEGYRAGTDAFDQCVKTATEQQLKPHRPDYFRSLD